MYQSLLSQQGRQRLVILGSGWAAGRLLRDIDSHLYDYTVHILCCLSDT